MKKLGSVALVLSIVTACGPSIPLVYPKVSIIDLRISEVKLLENHTVSHFEAH